MKRSMSSHVDLRYTPDPWLISTLKLFLEALKKHFLFSRVSPMHTDNVQYDHLR